MTTATDPAIGLRHRLAQQLSAAGTIRGLSLYRAFGDVPRELFVPDFSLRTEDGVQRFRKGEPGWLAAAHTDASLLTQHDQGGATTSASTAPTVMAHMLEALDLSGAESVLEIGTGTGYNAALLSHILGEDAVTSIDLDPGLVAAAIDHCRSAGYEPTLLCGNGAEGHPGGGPYDRLIATCGVTRIPSAWRYQVRPGGLIVACIGSGLVQLTIAENHRATGVFLPALASFMRIRGATTDTATSTQHLIDTALASDGATYTSCAPGDADHPTARFLTGFHQPDVREIVLTTATGATTRCLVHEPSGSWARATASAAGDVLEVVHAGPRDLWAERRLVLSAWAEAGHPTPDAYRLTISPDNTHTLQLTGPVA